MEKMRTLRSVYVVLFSIILFLSPRFAQAMEFDTDRPGMDYKSYDLLSPDPNLCERACKEDPNCRAWTYVKPGVQGPKARCWLKSGVPQAVKNTSCISGIMQQTPLTKPSGQQVPAAVPKEGVSQAQKQFGKPQEKLADKAKPVATMQQQVPKVQAAAGQPPPGGEKVHLDAQSRAFKYEFVPPMDGVYTAAVRGAANIPLKIQVQSSSVQPVANTGKGVLRVEFQAKKGTRWVATVETVPAGATIDTVFMMFSGAGPKARPLNAQQPLMLPATKDPIIPLVVRLMERHLSNIADRNEFDEAFDKALKQNPQMTRQLLEKFVQNYYSIPVQERKERFVEPGGGAKSAITRQHVLNLARAINPEFKLVAPVGLVAISNAPVVVKIEPAVPQGGYNPGDLVTLVGKNFSAKALENEIWLWRLTSGLDAGIDQQRVPTESTTTTQLTFKAPDSLSKGGNWFVYVKTPWGRTKDLQMPVKLATLPGRPQITGFDPPNMEPGMKLNIRGTGLSNDPVVTMFANDPLPLRGEFLSTSCVSKSDSWCQIELPQNMYAGTYEIRISGKGVGSLSDPVGYVVQPGRYRIRFEQFECLHSVSTGLWEYATDVVTIWGVIKDDASWSRASSKYGDIGGGHPPVPYNAGDGYVFAGMIPGNVEGFMDVRYGLILVTQLYEWRTDDPGKDLANSVKTIGGAVGGVVSIAFPAAGGAIATAANAFAAAIPMLAKLFGYTDVRMFIVPDKQKWTAPDLQSMAPGEIRPNPKNNIPPYTIKYGWGVIEDDNLARYGNPGKPDWDWFTEGDWRVKWRIERAPAR